MANKARRLLIQFGKVLPFVLCLILLISYAESMFALILSDYIYYDGYVILNTPISFYIGLKFEYDILIVIITLILSIAIETCVWNKLANIYLLAHLFEKSYFATIDVYVEYVYIIVIANMAISMFLVYKGVKMVTKW